MKNYKNIIITSIAITLASNTNLSAQERPWLKWLSGGWNLTCDKHELDAVNGLLKATCRRRTGGGTKRSVVYLPSCTKPVANIDGTLICN